MKMDGRIANELEINIDKKRAGYAAPFFGLQSCEVVADLSKVSDRLTQHFYRLAGLA